MQHYQMSWEDALHLVQNRRYCISPNGGFLTQIKVRTLWVIYVVIAAHFWRGQEYESIYKANYAVMSNPARTMAVSRRKRDDDDETDDPRYVSKRTLPIIFFPQYDKPTSDWNNFLSVKTIANGQFDRWTEPQMVDITTPTRWKHDGNLMTACIYPPHIYYPIPIVSYINYYSTLLREGRKERCP